MATLQNGFGARYLLLAWLLTVSTQGLELKVFESDEPLYLLASLSPESFLVAGRNVLYELSTEQLSTLQFNSTGPHLDHPSCGELPHAPCNATRVLMDDIPKVLLPFRMGGLNLVLTCGTLYHGLCRMRPTAAIGKGIWIGNGSTASSRVAGNASVVAFFVPSTQLDVEVLYSAAEEDGRDPRFHAPAAASRVVNIPPSKKPEFVFLHQTESAITAVDLDPKYKTSFKVNYLYGFSYGNFSYFLLTRRISPLVENVETFLARVCQGDPQWFSYTEVSLRCQRGILDVYELAQAAVLGPTGAVLRRPLRIPQDEDPGAFNTLYVAFMAATASHPSFPDPSKGSVVCSFPMPQVVSYFTNVTKECYQGVRHARTLQYITGDSVSCQAKAVDIDDNFCGSGFNPYIDGKGYLLGGLRANVTFPVSSLLVTVQNQKTVAFLGSQHGTITKINLEQPPGARHLYTVNLTTQLDASSPSPVKPSNFLGRSGEYAYFITGRKVVKFPAGSCSMYQECGTCITVKDPLRCYWCGSGCAHQDECETPALLSDENCPPFIEQVFPLSGPLSGSTVVTILGDNFGSSIGGQEASIHVTVADTPCTLVTWTKKRLQCKTTPVNKPREGFIHVRVRDTSFTLGDFNMNGNVTSSVRFTYLEPSVRNVSPLFGPLSGGTNVTITGRHLDIGARRSVRIAGVECRISKLTDGLLQCLTGPRSLPQEHSMINFTLDGTRLPLTATFDYKPDPTITKIEPQNSYMRGGRRLTVYGSHLDSVQTPILEVIFTLPVSAEQIKFYKKCQALPGGENMTCITPALRDVPPLPDNAPLVAHAAFVMDGVTALRNLPQSHPELTRILYYPDPKIRPLSSSLSPLNISDDDPFLEIEGSNLALLTNVTVTVGSHECEVVEHEDEKITCRLDSGIPANVELPVQVYLDGYAFSYGTIIWRGGTAATTASSSSGVLIALLTVIGVALLVLGLVWWWLRRRKLEQKELTPQARAIYRRDAGGSTVGFEPNEYQSMRRRTTANGSCCADDDRDSYQVDEETLHLLQIEKILISRECLIFGDIIGQGHFGRVYRGDLLVPGKEASTQVAIKTLHESQIRTENDPNAFLKEGLIMKDFKHKNVLSLIGVSFEDNGKPMVIIPYMANGDLLSYLRNENNHPTVKLLIQFGVQIASGMRYLSDMKFVHRDLAARNCMLDQDLTVKVADFGLSRDIYEKDYYSSDNKTKLPVKWMAIESLEKGTYNTKTDVWSYGVVLWELMTRGCQPYPDVGNWEIVQYIKLGHRMLQPSSCPKLLYDIMLRCWQVDPKMRPTFGQLEVEVQGVITKLEKRNKERQIGLDVTYVNVPQDSEPAAC